MTATGQLQHTAWVEQGAWSQYSSAPTVATAAGDGPHTISARTRDAAGNEDPTPPELSFTVDTVAPTATVRHPSMAAGTGGNRLSCFARRREEVMKVATTMLGQLAATSSCEIPRRPAGTCSSDSRRGRVMLTDAHHAGRVRAATGRRRVSFVEAVEGLAVATGATVRYLPVSTERSAALLADPRVPEEVVVRLRRVVTELLDVRDARPM